VFSHSSAGDAAVFVGASINEQILALYGEQQVDIILENGSVDVQNGKDGERERCPRVCIAAALLSCSPLRVSVCGCGCVCVCVCAPCAGDVLLLGTGEIVIGTSPVRPFAQSFHLAATQNTTAYYIRNDILRVFNLPTAATPAVVAAVPAPAAVPAVAAAPAPVAVVPPPVPEAPVAAPAPVVTAAAGLGGDYVVVEPVTDAADAAAAPAPAAGAGAGSGSAGRGRGGRHSGAAAAAAAAATTAAAAPAPAEDAKASSSKPRSYLGAAQSAATKPVDDAAAAPQRVRAPRSMCRSCRVLLLRCALLLRFCAAL
jgi:hypothetical protein